MRSRQRTVATSTEPRRAAEEPGSGEARPRTFLIERAGDSAGSTASNKNADAADASVVIAVIADPERLLRERGLAFHGDVVDLLTELVLAMEDDTRAEQDD